MSSKFSDRLFTGGIVALVLSIIIFCVPFFIELPREDYFGLFIPNYVLCAGYFLVLLTSGRLRRGREGLFPLFIFLILFLISAYSLNREMNVFEDSVAWFSSLLVLSCLNYLSFAFYSSVPRVIQTMMLLLLGVSLILFVYMSSYLVPLYVGGIVVAIGLGISLHAFVPLLFTIYSIVLIRKLQRNDSRVIKLVSIGASLAVVITVAFSIQWAGTVSEINKVYRNKNMDSEVGLPGWVSVAQKLPQGIITEKLLKSDLVYSVPQLNRNWERMFRSIPTRLFDEQRKHDPLVMVAALFGGQPNMETDDRVRVLESIFDARHQSEERLWSGENLLTENVKTVVKFWPEYCLAYTEKILTVTNFADKKSWPREEEAIYTFQLPEGAAVTALSLWIDGTEEKGILTSKEKAQTAYQTIVGKERRDPSVVHWKEGNRVSVRVFPVIAGESRKFKMGITAPLSRTREQMLYRNISFKGPDATKAEEEIEIAFSSPVKGLIVPASLEKPGDNYTWKGPYQSKWEVSMQQQPISTNRFSFDGHVYSIHPYEKHKEYVNFQEVYLDINTTWTEKEFEQVWEIVRNKKIFVFDDKIVRLTDDNRVAMFNRLTRQRFSLFPLFEINDPGKSLLITKNSESSPNLQELSNSRFSASLSKYLINQTSLLVFSIGDVLSPYLKTLKEYRCFRYESGTISDLNSIVLNNHFAKSIENESRVVLDDAGIIITRDSGTTAAKAPDHLMRLFSYNHIMQQKGKGMMQDSVWDQQLVEEARRAYVVTPLSSLIVLESQADYKRFDIMDADKSLKNAASKDNGASPEPHEWALILLVLLITAYLKFPAKFKSLIKR